MDLFRTAGLALPKEAIFAFCVILDTLTTIIHASRVVLMGPSHIIIRFASYLKFKTAESLI
jgi:hypothetical protein